jgi:hypothetical protein
MSSARQDMTCAIENIIKPYYQQKFQLGSRKSDSVLGEILGSNGSEYEDDCLLSCCAV